MINVAVLLRKSTLAALTEHSVHTVGGAIPINENESLVLLTADTLMALLERARPEDTRLDDVIVRIAL